jgi:hypothetical protein
VGALYVPDISLNIEDAPLVYRNIVSDIHEAEGAQTFQTWEWFTGRMKGDGRRQTCTAGMKGRGEGRKLSWERQADPVRMQGGGMWF